MEQFVEPNGLINYNKPNPFSSVQCPHRIAGAQTSVWLRYNDIVSAKLNYETPDSNTKGADSNHIFTLFFSVAGSID